MHVLYFVWGFYELRLSFLKLINKSKTKETKTVEQGFKTVEEIILFHRLLLEVLQAFCSTKIGEIGDISVHSNVFSRIVRRQGDWRRGEGPTRT